MTKDAVSAAVENKDFRVLQELGILVLSAEAARPSRIVSPAAHIFSDHAPSWSYHRTAQFRSPYDTSLGMRDLLGFLPAGTTVPQALEHTRLLVFIGADWTPELEQALERPEALKVIYEPDPQRLAAMVRRRGTRAFVNRTCIIVCGELDAFSPPLLLLLPDSICSHGFPVFFSQYEMTAACDDAVRRFVEALEVFYYRNAIYPIAGQDNIRGRPLRPMLRKMIYDRLHNIYANLTISMSAGAINDLKGGLQGETALLAAAGPSLQQHILFIREHRENMVLIAVNSALRPLLEAGVEPDFAVINDTSLDSARSLCNLPPVGHCRLVAHCLSGTGCGAFRQIHVFGNYERQPFPQRDGLQLHGSVITTAFSLAEYLGCSRALLAGVQLGSEDRHRLGYAAGTMQRERLDSMPPVTADREQLEDQLYPACAADGSILYTTLNFLDSSFWFRDRIRTAALEVVNMDPRSLVFGEPIVIDPEPELPASPGLPARIRQLPCTPPQVSNRRVEDMIQAELQHWRGRMVEAKAMCKALEQDPAALARAAQRIKDFDADNTSYALQRFGDFRNPHFHRLFFEGADDARRLQGALYYFKHLEAMSRSLFELLVEQLKLLLGR